MGNQTLGRGELHFSLFKPGTFDAAGFRYLGNTPDFSLANASQTLDHYSSDRGVKEKDKSVDLQNDSSAKITLDDIQPENVAITFLGTSETLSQASGTALTQTLDAVSPGFSYPLGISDANPTGDRSVTITSVTRAGTDTLTAGTDFTVDEARGIVTIVGGGPHDVVDGDDLVVTYDRAAVSRKQVISGNTQVEGVLQFRAYNPEGDDFDYLMSYVKLSPNGDFNLKADTWQQIQWNVEILKAPNRERIYVDGQPYTP